jgi:hypothetical protein
LSSTAAEAISSRSNLFSTSNSMDNAFNVLQGTLLEQINEFFGPKCDAVAKKP